MEFFRTLTKSIPLFTKKANVFLGEMTSPSSRVEWNLPTLSFPNQVEDRLWACPGDLVNKQILLPFLKTLPPYFCTFTQRAHVEPKVPKPLVVKKLVRLHSFIVPDSDSFLTSRALRVQAPDKLIFFFHKDKSCFSEEIPPLVPPHRGK